MLVIYAISIAAAILIILLGVVFTSSFHGEPLIQTIIFDLSTILVSLIIVYFLFVIPNRSRILTEAELLYPSTAEIERQRIFGRTGTLRMFFSGRRRKFGQTRAMAQANDISLTKL